MDLVAGVAVIILVFVIIMLLTQKQPAQTCTSEWDYKLYLSTKADEQFSPMLQLLANETLDLSSNVVMFIVGSSETFALEHALAKLHRDWKIFVFDCFSAPPQEPQSFSFIPLCLGSDNHGMFRTLAELAKEARVESVHVLKIGGEWDTLVSLLSQHALLPQQLMVHFYLSRDVFKTAFLASMLYHNGYRMTYYNCVNNQYCDLTLKKFY